MIYKMQLSDSVDTMIFELLEVPIEGKDITGIADNTTIDGNVFRDYLWLKKQWTQRWSIMCQDEYERLRGFWTRQFGNAEVPLYRLFYGENRYEDKNTFTVNGFVQIENDAPLYSPLSLTHLYGNAEQKTLSGKNLLPTLNTARTISGVTFTPQADGSILVNGTATAQINYPINVDSASPAQTITIEADTYTIGGGANSIVNSLYVQAYYKETGGSTKYANGTFTTTADGILGAYIRVASGTAVSNKIIYPQLEKGSSATNFEEYCGGSPMPNPQFPSPVNVVTGEQTVKITGKNLAKIDPATRTSNGITYVWSADGSVTLNGTATAISATDATDDFPIKLRAGQVYTFSANNAEISSGVTIRLERGNGKTGVFASGITNDTSKTWSFNGEDTDARLQVRIASGTTLNNFTLRPQLELGNQASAYETYKEQIYVLPFGDTYLAKIGDYADEPVNVDGTWYIRRAIGKVVLDGTEAWSQTANACAFYLSMAGVATAPADTIPSVMSDYYTANTYRHVAGVGDADYGIATHTSSSRISIRNKDITTTANFKTWLASHNTTVYYALATPTDTEITDSELIEQLNHIYSLYGGVNNLWLIPSGGAQGEIGVKYRLNYEEETDIIPSTPVVLTLSDGGVINTCGCRQNIQLIMRETESD